MKEKNNDGYCVDCAFFIPSLTDDRPRCGYIRNPVDGEATTCNYARAHVCKGEHFAALPDVSRQRLADKEKQIVELRDKNTSLEIQLANLMGENRKLKSEIDKFKARRDFLESSIARAKNLIDQLEQHQHTCRTTYFSFKMAAGVLIMFFAGIIMLLIAAKFI